MLRSTLIFLGLTASLAAQSLTGPATAWYFEPSQRALRAIAGLPGAASFGPALVTDIAAASAAPGCRQALLQREGQWSLYPQTATGDPLIAAEKITWSPNGDTALLTGAGQFQLLRHGVASPAQPLPNGRVEALAASAQEAALVIDGTLYRISAQNELSTALPLAATALAYAGNTLYAVDRAAGRVFKVTHAAELAAEIPEPLGLTQDSAGHLLVIAAHEIVILNGALKQNIPTDSTVTAWQPGCHADHLLLQTATELTLFRAGATPGLFFIPAEITQAETTKEEN